MFVELSSFLLTSDLLLYNVCGVAGVSSTILPMQNPGNMLLRKKGHPVLLDVVGMLMRCARKKNGSTEAL